jgi:outer membrane protein OmpA-like peptidoglycan-associated protein
VAETRLRAVGFGQEKPAETNDTPVGREANRRVEFNSVSQ